MLENIWAPIHQPRTSLITHSLMTKMNIEAERREGGGLRAARRRRKVTYEARIWYNLPTARLGPE